MKMNTLFNNNLLIFIRDKIDIIKHINNILNDITKTRKHKRFELYQYIRGFIKNIITTKKKKPTNSNIKSNICLDRTKLECNDPCKYINTKCKLNIESENINELMKRFIYRFIELLLIYGIDKSDPNNIFNQIHSKVEPYELKKSVNPDEYFFTYIDFMDEYLDLLFDKKNIFIDNYKIIDEKLFEKTETLQNDIHMYDSDSPIIIQKLIYEDAKLNLYDSDTNMDLTIISNCMNYIDMYEDLTSEDIINKLDRDNENVEIENLYELTKHYKNIGYLYISKKYSKRENKYEIYSIYNHDTSLKDIYFILLFDIKNETEYRLANIMINKNYVFTHSELIEYNSELDKYFEKSISSDKSSSDESLSSDKSSSDESLSSDKSSSDKSLSPEIIRIGKVVKWNNSRGQELKGEIVNETSNSWIICCKPGKAKGNGNERDGRYYRVKREMVRL